MIIRYVNSNRLIQAAKFLFVVRKNVKLLNEVIELIMLIYKIEQIELN